MWMCDILDLLTVDNSRDYSKNCEVSIIECKAVTTGIFRYKLLIKRFGILLDTCPQVLFTVSIQDQRTKMKSVMSNLSNIGGNLWQEVMFLGVFVCLFLSAIT